MYLILLRQPWIASPHFFPTYRKCGGGFAKTRTARGRGFGVQKKVNAVALANCNKGLTDYYICGIIYMQITLQPRGREMKNKTAKMLKVAAIVLWILALAVVVSNMVYAVAASFDFERLLASLFSVAQTVIAGLILYALGEVVRLLEEIRDK
jgi:hypothetical protein